ncbi:hypothetical protein [Paracoccus sphaerophysae]|uniref:hypothetical protein n=1 Tax=Paracoccus sphaerophysae TaxID=690417 RepID=UPI0012EC5E5C|nr:hypothetical protein [Paracoccus sphaerophysae]
MIRLARLSGLDDRFMLFVVGTMALSVVVSSAGAAIAFVNARKCRGGRRGSGDGPCRRHYGLWSDAADRVSAVSHRVRVGLLAGRRRGGLTVSAEYAGIATAAVATVLWIALMTRSNGDGAEIVVGVVGIAAIMLAPSVARWAYRDRSGHVTKPAGAGIR